jgi:hypothetical protein
MLVAGLCRKRVARADLPVRAELVEEARLVAGVAEGLGFIAQIPDRGLRVAEVQSGQRRAESEVGYPAVRVEDPVLERKLEARRRRAARAGHEIHRFVLAQCRLATGEVHHAGRLFPTLYAGKIIHHFSGADAGLQLHEQHARPLLRQLDAPGAFEFGWKRGAVVAPPILRGRRSPQQQVDDACADHDACRQFVGQLLRRLWISQSA